MKTWKASAPSNIALIKYMGKSDTSVNKPTNSSLSYTLGHLRSYVEIEKTDDTCDSWKPLTKTFSKGGFQVELSEEGQKRYLNHLSAIKKEFSYVGNFNVRSTNGFPSDCGLASSASSFAALTLAACQALGEETGKELSLLEMIELSRRGSGSSCRSFMESRNINSWVEWGQEGVKEISKIPYNHLLHLCVVVSKEKKEVSSSAAHVKILESALFSGRVTRAEDRLRELKEALIKKDWRRAYEVTWSEFWDMHSLFETSCPPFGYMSSGSLEVLETVREQWNQFSDGPIVTMDAGANVHLLFREDQAEILDSLSASFNGKFSVIDSRDFS